MAKTYNRRINIFVNGKEVKNDIASIKKAMYQVTNEQARMTRGSKEYVAHGKKIKYLRGVIDKHNQSLRQSKGLWSKIKNVLPIASFAAFGAGILRIGKNLLGIASNMQGEAKRSAIVFGNSLDYVEKKADQLSKKMGVTNHQFVTMASNTGDLLIPLDFSRKKASEMSVELQGLAGALDEWTAGKYGVAEVSNILTKAMLGEMEQLKGLGIAIRQDSIEFRDLVKEKKAAGAATDAQARALATLELIYKKSADAQTAYNQEGNKLLRVQKSLVLWWRKKKENVIAYFETKPSEKLEQERKQVNLLVFEYNDANTTEARRLEIKKELMKLAPDIAKSMSDEETSTLKTTAALKKYNEQMINRVILAGKEEQLKKLTKKAAKAKEKEMAAEEKLNEEILKRIEAIKDEARQQKLMDIMLDKNLTTIEKANKLEEEGLKLRAQRTKYTGIFGETSSRDAVSNFEIFKNLAKNRKKIMDDMATDIQDFKENSGLDDLFKVDSPDDQDSGKNLGPFETQLKNLETFNQKKILRIKQNYADEKLSASQYHSELLHQEMQFLKDKQALQQKFEKDTTDVQTKITDIHIKANEKIKELQEEQAKELFESIKESDEEMMEWLFESGDAELDALMKKFEAEDKLKEDADKRDKERDQNAHDEKIQRLEAYQEISGTIFNGIADMFESAKQRELKAAGDNDKEKEKIERKYAKRQQSIAILQTAIEGLLEIARINSNAAVTADLSQTLRAILTGAAIIRTGATIAAIAGDGYSDGGFTGAGRKNEPAGIVHKEEWVANKELVKDPLTGQIINALELIRTGKMDKQALVLPNFSAMSNIPQLQSGGYGQHPGSSHISQSQNDIKLCSRNRSGTKKYDIRKYKSNPGSIF